MGRELGVTMHRFDTLKELKQQIGKFDNKFVVPMVYNKTTGIYSRITDEL